AIQLGARVVQLLVRPAPFEELADLAANGGEDAEQLFLGLPDLAAEELEHAVDLAAEEDRKAECRVEIATFRDRRAREVRVARDVGDPRRCPARPHAAREADAPGEGRRAARGFERLELRSRVVPAV